MEVAVLAVIFGTVFAIAYLYFTTRNKERMALIENGADASIFVKGKREHAAPIWKILILNLALLLMGIGLGIFIAALIRHYTELNADAVFPAIIFTMAGIGLFIGYNMTKNIDKE